MKLILESIYHLMFFKPYTHMPRWVEMTYGIVSWICLGITSIGIYRIIL